MKAWFRAAVHWALVIACGLVAFWAVCLLCYLAIVLFIFSAVVSLVRGALQ